MANSFADDGAAGGGNFGNASIGPGSTVTSTPTSSASAGSGGVETNEPSASANQGYVGSALQETDGSAAAPGNPDFAGQPLTANPLFGGIMFDDGGAVPDTAQGQGDALTQQINKALGTVDSVLDYGRKLHGLGGGDDTQSGGIQEANAGYSNGRMPAVPGSQSNSGAPPIQPMPGPLPPTSNPFGKRADASDDSSPDDQDQGTQGGIQDDDQESA